MEVAQAKASRDPHQFAGVATSKAPGTLLVTADYWAEARHLTMHKRAAAPTGESD